MDSQNESQKFSIINLDILKAKLRPSAKLVYAAIASYYRGQNSLIFPSYNRLAATLGINRRTVITAVKELIEAGVLKKDAQMRTDGGFSSNLYTLHPSNLNSLPSDLNYTSPSDLNYTSPSDLNSPRLKDNPNKNNLFKINNIRARGAKNAAGEMLRTPEQTDLEDYVPTNKDFQLLKIVNTSKTMSWFELVRIRQTYYIRPRSSRVFSYVSSEEMENLREFIAQSAGSCQALKYGQRFNEEIIIND